MPPKEEERTAPPRRGKLTITTFPKRDEHRKRASEPWLVLKRPSVAGFEAPIDILAEVPQRPQFREIVKHLPQVVPFLLGQTCRAFDNQEAMSPDERRLLPGCWATRPATRLLPLVGTAPPPRAAGRAPPRLGPPQAPDGVQDARQQFA